MKTLMDAIRYAQERHGEQRRVGGGPVMAHLLGTAALLVATGEDDENVLMAAVLHDVVEDTETTFTELEVEFGPRIAGLVSEVTKDADGNFPIVTPAGARIKMADRLNNLRDLDRCNHSFKVRQVLKTFELCLTHGPAFMASNLGLYVSLVGENKRRYKEVTSK